VSGETIGSKFLTAASLAMWIVIIFLPLFVLFVQVIAPTAELETADGIFASVFRSFGLSAAIAGTAVLLGWIPGRLLGTCRTRKDLLLLLLLIPMVLPRYVLYYAWTLMLSPTTSLGAYLSGRPDLARFVGAFSSSVVLIFWYWPLAALLIAQGWRNIDRQIWDCASLDANDIRKFRDITLPLLARPLLLAFSVCFVLSLSEFATFHLAGIRTIGTELAVLYELTGSEGSLAGAAWPVVVAALLLAVILGKSSRSWVPQSVPHGSVEVESHRWRWIVLLALIGISLVIPVTLLIGNMTDTQALRQFFRLHPDELGWSLVVAAVAAVIAYLIAFGALSLDRCTSGLCKQLSFIFRTTIFLVMFVPACLVAVCLLKILAVCNVPPALRQGGSRLDFAAPDPVCPRKAPVGNGVARWCICVSEMVVHSFTAYVARFRRDIHSDCNAEHNGIVGYDGAAAGGIAELRPASAQPDALRPGPAGNCIVPGLDLSVPRPGRDSRISAPRGPGSLAGGANNSRRMHARLDGLR
jgi:ABC-type Fe3+ transport system permease subunit